MNRRNLLLAAATLAFVPLAAQAHEFKAGELVIGHPWSRATGQSRPAVGYLKIRNTGTETERLLGVETPIADHVMIHANVIDEGVARMTALEGLEIPPGEEISLAPKSDYHFMIMGLKQPLKEGDTFPATLIFEHAGRIDVTFVTAAAGATGEED